MLTRRCVHAFVMVAAILVAIGAIGVSFAQAQELGGAGTICGMANVVPGLVQAMINGSGSEARMQAAIDVVASGPSFPATLKAILAAQSGDAGWLRVRPPLRPCSDGAAFKAKLDALASPAIA